MKSHSENSPSNYSLLDFGGGRKLELFDKIIFDRPAPAALGIPIQNPEQWKDADLFLERNDESCRWHGDAESIADLYFEWNEIRLKLAASPHGHLGVFAEQMPNWQWMKQQAGSLAGKRILNLFAYTGGSTLVAASCGARVTHIDSAKNIVQRARRNAEASRLADRPVRWITEDARRFVQREAKRGNRYDGFILDPPSYGHGTGHQSWKIERDLSELMSELKQISSRQISLFLFTCHSSGFDSKRMLDITQIQFAGSSSLNYSSGPLSLKSVDGRKLQSGYFVRAHS